MGKTALGVQFGLHAAEQGEPGMIFSLEMKAKKIAERAISHYGRVDAHLMRTGTLGTEDWSKVFRAVAKIEGAAPLLIDGSPRLTVERIQARARRAKRQHGLSIVVIDYLQLIEGAASEDKRNNEIAAITRGLKLLANELEVPVVVLSQLNRQVDARPNKRPMLSDLRDSGAIEQDADLVLFVYRDEFYHPETEAKGQAEIIIGKQRDGVTGTVRASFMGQWSRFDNSDWVPREDGPRTQSGQFID